jgi:hypothetical protein
MNPCIIIWAEKIHQSILPLILFIIIDIPAIFISLFFTPIVVSSVD